LFLLPKMIVLLSMIGGSGVIRRGCKGVIQFLDALAQQFHGIG
jgi:hypothetical protein